MPEALRVVDKHQAKRLLGVLLYGMIKERDHSPPLSDAILASARSWFRRQGFDLIKVREIAKAKSMMTSGGLFYHFATKEDLLVAIMEEGVST